MIYIRVRSRREIEDQYVGDSFVVSIVSPGTEHPKIGGTNIHQFHFHDIREDLMVESNCFSGIMNAMTKDMAEAIVEVAMNNRDIETWLIHCEAGISRSPAVAIGLARHLKCTPTARELERMYPCYNKHVEGLIATATRKKVCEIAHNLRVQFNFD